MIVAQSPEITWSALGAWLPAQPVAIPTPHADSSHGVADHVGTRRGGAGTPKNVPGLVGQHDRGEHQRPPRSSPSACTRWTPRSSMVSETPRRGWSGSTSGYMRRRTAARAMRDAPTLPRNAHPSRPARLAARSSQRATAPPRPPRRAAVQRDASGQRPATTTASGPPRASPLAGEPGPSSRTSPSVFSARYTAPWVRNSSEHRRRRRAARTG